MKLWNKLIPLVLVFFYAVPATAEEGADLVNYLKALGGYFGYDVTTPPQTLPPNFSLLDIDKNTSLGAMLINTYLGSIIVPSIGDGTSPNLVPSKKSSINDYVNLTFTKPEPYSSYSAHGVTVNPLIDQTNNSSSAQSSGSAAASSSSAQNDPVSQSVVNILSTTDITNCYDSNNNWVGDCPLQYQYLTMANAIGTWPPTPVPGKPIFDYTNYIKPLVGQLNSDSLIGPLLYDTTNTSSNNNSKGSSDLFNASATPSSATGLNSQNQAQTAANFIRYAAYMTMPFTPANFANYLTTYTLATTPVPASGTNPTAQQIEEAQNTVLTYMAGLRVYAAQSSVAISNLYSMLSRRMPQQGSGDDKISEALAEFRMATWRLKPESDQSGKTKPAWIQQINAASPATIQKEMAILLAEINYQLYLSRQQQERILLTNSMMLLQATKNNIPTFPTPGAPQPQ